MRIRWEHRHPYDRVEARITGVATERKRPAVEEEEEEEKLLLHWMVGDDGDGDDAIQGLMLPCTHRWNTGTVGLLLLRIILEAGGRKTGKGGEGSDQHPPEESV